MPSLLYGEEYEALGEGECTQATVEIQCGQPPRGVDHMQPSIQQVAAQIHPGSRPCPVIPI